MPSLGEATGWCGEGDISGGLPGGSGTRGGCPGFCRQDCKITSPKLAWVSVAALQPRQLGGPKPGSQDTWGGGGGDVQSWLSFPL